MEYAILSCLSLLGNLICKLKKSFSFNLFEPDPVVNASTGS